MSLPVEIKDGTGTKRRVKVTTDNALLVTSLDSDGFQTDDEVLTRFKLFRSFLRSSAGSKELNVDGSTTNVEFVVKSDPGKILYVTQLRVLINGTYFELDTQDFRRFGTATTGGSPLTNGITLQAIQGGVYTDLFAEPIKYTGDFLNYADDFVNLKNSVGAQEDFLSFDFDFEKPVVLPEAATDRLAMTIRDNLSSILLFQVAVRGYQEVK